MTEIRRYDFERKDYSNMTQYELGQEVNQRAEILMLEKDLSYEEAIRLVALDDLELFHRYIFSNNPKGY